MKRPRDYQKYYERRLLPEKQNRKSGHKQVREPLRKGLLRAALDYWDVKNGYSTALNGPSVWPLRRSA